MAHKWAQWLHHPCLLRDSQCRAQRENKNGRDVGIVATSTLPSQGSPMPSKGENITNGQQSVTVATLPLPSPGSPMPSKGRIPEMAHKLAHRAHHPCFLGHFHAQQLEKVTNGPTVAKVATSALPSRGSPMPSTRRKSEMAHKWAQWLHHRCLLGAPQCPSRGENQKWPTSGHSGYITPAFLRFTNAQQGEKIRNGPQVGTVPTSPLPSGGSPMPSTGEKSERSHKQAWWLHQPCLLGAPQCRARGKSEMAHKWAQWLHHPCLLGAPPYPARAHNQKWPTSGHNGYITPAFSGLPNAQQGENIKNGLQVGKAATSPVPSRGSPMPSTGRK